MKFTCNTKPLADALALGIINSNVSNFYKKSCIVEVSADAHMLKVNVEAAMICTELRIKGSGEGDPASIFVDSLLFKQLVSTLDTSVITLEFSENGLILHSGKSKFNLPKMIDSAEFDLKSPKLADYSDSGSAVDQKKWKFIKDYQMYAISLAFIHPVYTRVWVGEHGDVLVGDFDSSLFTHSKMGDLGKQCLLSDTIINLFNALPEGARIVEDGDDYIIHIVNDSFEYLTQFTPMYESNPDIGSYNSDIFLNMMKHPNDSVEVPVSSVVKLLNQALLLSTTSEDTILVAFKGDHLILKDRNVDGQIPVKGTLGSEFSVEFKLETLRKVISNYEEETIHLSPMVQGGEPVGVIVWGADLTTIVAGVE